jgi:hypothetical protein
MKRSAIVFGFVGSCVGMAFKGTAQPGKRRATKFRFVRPRCNRAGNFGAKSPAKWSPRWIIVGEHSGHESGQALEME